MQKRVKVAALSLIAVTIITAIMLMPFTTASASVYQDSSYNGSISGTIENEPFPAMSSQNYIGLAFSFSANNAGGYATILNHPLVCTIDVDTITYEFVFDYIANTSQLTCTVYVYDAETYYINGNVYSAPLYTTANYWSFGVYGTATSMSYYVILNSNIYADGVAVTQNTSAIRYLTVGNVFDGALDISTFSTSAYHFGYGAISYQTISQIRRAAAQGSYKDGYAVGLIDGADNWDSFIGWDWLKAAISIVGTVLTIEIAPNIYLGYFVALPLILGAVMFVLQFKR